MHAHIQQPRLRVAIQRCDAAITVLVVSRRANLKEQLECECECCGLLSVLEKCNKLLVGEGMQ